MTHDDTQDEQHAQSTETRNRKPLNLKNLRTMWRKANPIARIGMVATATVAAIAAIAIIVGAVRFIGWRVQVNEALTAQSQSQSQYDFNPGNIIPTARSSTAMR